jgi:predicted nucleic acid-binding Zn finger protein
MDGLDEAVELIQRREVASLPQLKTTIVKTDDSFLYLKEDSYYEVDILSNICTCPDQRRRGGLCKHLMAAKTIEGKIEVLASL